MALDLATIGKTQSKAITGADDHVVIGNFPGVMILSTVDGHITIDGSPATVSECPILANERISVIVDGKNPASAVGQGEVHFIKAASAADGTIWITEAC